MLKGNDSRKEKHSFGGGKDREKEKNIPSKISFKVQIVLQEMVNFNNIITFDVVFFIAVVTKLDLTKNLFFFSIFFFFFFIYFLFFSRR